MEYPDENNALATSTSTDKFEKININNDEKTIFTDHDYHKNNSIDIDKVFKDHLNYKEKIDAQLLKAKNCCTEKGNSRELNSLAENTNFNKYTVTRSGGIKHENPVLEISDSIATNKIHLDTNELSSIDTIDVAFSEITSPTKKLFGNHHTENAINDEILLLETDNNTCKGKIFATKITNTAIDVIDEEVTKEEYRRKIHEFNSEHICYFNYSSNNTYSEDEKNCILDQIKAKKNKSLENLQIIKSTCDSLLDPEKNTKSAQPTEKDESQVNCFGSDNSDNAQDKFPDDKASKHLPDEESIDANNLLEVVASIRSSHNSEQFEEHDTKQSDTESSDLTRELNKNDATYNKLKNDIIYKIEEDNYVYGTNSTKRALASNYSMNNVKKLKIDNLTHEINEKYSQDNRSNYSEKCSADLQLNFLKQFKKSLYNITKPDLEELVLEKVVEAIVYHGDLSEMREKIDKQEKLIALHRNKVQEITKQFRDLEMVHNRVVKDLDQKNRQFIMPVKITRAVGLQVLIPKRFEYNSGIAKNSCHYGIKLNQSSSMEVSSTNLDIIKRGRHEELSSENMKRVKYNQKVTPLRSDMLHRPVVNINSRINPITQSAISKLCEPHQMNLNKPQLLLKTFTRNTSQQSKTKSQNNSLNQCSYEVDLIAKPPCQKETIDNKFHKNGEPFKPNTQLKAFENRIAASTAKVSIESSSVLLKKTSAGRCMVAASQTIVNCDPLTNVNKSVIDLTHDEERTIANSSTVSQSSKLFQQANYTRLSHSNLNSESNIVLNDIRHDSSKIINGVQHSTTAKKNESDVGMQRSSLPAPLPKAPQAFSSPNWKAPPSRPSIRINNIDTGIVISWTMDDLSDENADIASYQIYAYEDNTNPQIETWRHVGDVKAMLLPMAVTLTQFQEGQRYFFAVRAVDIHGRVGTFSIPKTWS